MKAAILIALVFVLMAFIARLDDGRMSRLQGCQVEGWSSGCAKMSYQGRAY